MLIQLKDFGPISYFEFDTEKQMHFIFGENNIGKSYAISAVYLILKNMINTPLGTLFMSTPLRELQPDGLPMLEKLVKTKIEQSSTSDIDIHKEIVNVVGFLLDSYFIPSTQQALLNTFDDFSRLKNEFSQKNSEIILKFASGNIFHFAIANKQLVLKSVHLEAKIIIRKINMNRIPSQSYSKIIIYQNIKNGNIFGLNSISYLILNEDFRELKQSYAQKIFFLPASRSGLYNSLNSFGAIFAELSQSRTRITHKFNIPEMAEQISDYFLNLSNIKTGKNKDSFSEIAQLIEQKVLKGNVSFDDNTKKTYFQPEKTNILLELSNTSSMISEIAPLVAHLKYIISDNAQKTNGQDILFIEEPEAHLHPKIQVELMKIFALLAQKGLKIVMTSHSNYLFNKLSNMILAKEIDPSTIRVAHMKLGEMGSYVDENSMQVDQDGIDDDNFSETAEALYLERMKLYKQNH